MEREFIRKFGIHNGYLSLMSGSKTPRSTQKRVARMDKIMDDLRKEKKSMSPGQKTMVPGHRPLPGLGGAHRLTPKAGMLSGPAGTQRSPGSAMAAGGLRLSAANRALSPASAQSGQPIGSSGGTLLRPPLSSMNASAVSETLKQTVGVHTNPLVPSASSSSTTGVLNTIPTQANVSSSLTPHHSAQTASNAVTPTIAAPPVGGSEDNKPAQAITMVQPTAADGTPQRPALPKLKIRKDLIS